MSAVERAASSASRKTSFQRLPVMERKYKMERLPNVFTPTMPPISLHNQACIQDRRARSLSRGQVCLFLGEEEQRDISAPISTKNSPVPTKVETGVGSSGDMRMDEEFKDEPRNLLDATPETVHKQVKFLAPHHHSDSDQSSICHSPSWEGYGQKSKDKKSEVERKKQVKERAEKDAKALKKRLPRRLCKSPPAKFRQSRECDSLIDVDHSTSGPLLSRHQLTLVERMAQHLENTTREKSTISDAPAVQTNQLKMIDTAEGPESRRRSFLGGIKLAREEAETVQDLKQLEHPSPAHSAARGHSRQPLNRFKARGKEVEPCGSTRHILDSRSPREASFPPSASRTIRLRPTPAPVFDQRNKSMQAVSHSETDEKMGCWDSPEEPSSVTYITGSKIASSMVRGRHREGYVRRQRDQSTERAMSGLADEQLHAGFNINPSSSSSTRTRSECRNIVHRRRSSFTQEIKSVAMRLAGLKTAETAGSERKGHGRAKSTSDYFLMTSGHNRTSPSLYNRSHYEYHGSLRSTSEAGDFTGGFPMPQDVLPPQHGTDSSDLPAGELASRGPNWKTRNLRQFAKTALNISQKAPSASNNSKPPISLPLFLAKPYSKHPLPDAPPGGLTQVGSHYSQSAKPILKDQTYPIRTDAQTPEQARTEYRSAANMARNSISFQTVQSQAHVSHELSSFLETDLPTLQSPATGPRNGSSLETAEEMELLAELQPRNESVQQPSDISCESTAISTPRLDYSDPHESTDMDNGERWNGTALTLEPDLDAETFVTSPSNLDQVDYSGHIDRPLVGMLTATCNQSLNMRRQLHDRRAPYEWGEANGAHKASRAQPKTNRSSSEPDVRSNGSLGSRDSCSLPLLPPEFDVLLRSECKASTSGPSEPSSVLCQKNGAAQQRADSQTRLLRKQLNTTCREDYRRNLTDEPSTVDRDGGKNDLGPSNRQDMQRELEGKFDASAKGLVGSMMERKVWQRRRLRRENEVYQERQHGNQKPGETDCSANLEPIQSYGGQIVGNSMPRTQELASPETRRTQTISSSPSERPGTQASETVAKSAVPSSKPNLPYSMRSATQLRSLPRHLLTRSSPLAPDTPAPVHTTSITSCAAPRPAPRPVTSGPVSILKSANHSQSPSMSPVESSQRRGSMLSALPEHLQLKNGAVSRTPSTFGQSRASPMAKVFVECCSCMFFHDMPSKIYECMARPDALIEDRALGLSGAITTAVKCPWCQHSMSTRCCAGYAAVVYLEEKLH